MGKDDWVTVVLAAVIVLVSLALGYVVTHYIEGVWYG